jgi:hypothetical protein
LCQRQVVVIAGERGVVDHFQQSGLAAEGLVDGLLRDPGLVGHEPNGRAGEPASQERRASRVEHPGARRPSGGGAGAVVVGHICSVEFVLRDLSIHLTVLIYSSSLY